MSIPEFPKFKEIELSDRREILRRLDILQPKICEFNFTNLYIWKNFDHSKLTRINDNLCIHCSPPNETAFYYIPIGENDIEKTLEVCFSSAHRLSRVPEEFIDRFIKNNKKYKFECDRHNSDYVYLASDLINLRGKKYDGKRNHIRKFKNKYNYKYRKLIKSDYEECLKLLKNWEKQKRYLTNLAIRSQEEAIGLIFKYFDELKVFAGLIEVNNKIEAFSIASPLNNETANIHIEIANPTLLGLFQTINQEFVAAELSSYKFINREQDMGLPGLRKAKTSYHPIHLELKFDVFKI